MDDSSKVRKCSSCKLVLPSHLFKSDTSNYHYKTCLPCRYKKRLKYYSTLSNVPLSKREKTTPLSSDLLHRGQSYNPESTPPCEYSSTSSVNDLTFKMQVISVIPQAKWVACENDATEHCFIASAVLTPLSLDHYVGTSRKYSVLY